MTSTTRTIDQLGLSPFNVRTFRPDAEDTSALEASLLAKGQLNALDVHPMLGNPKKWGVAAGGRRYRSFARLIERGELPRDHPIAVLIHEGLSDAELIELSITENLQRRDLRDHELCAGVARASAKGHDAGQIAAALGQPDADRVTRWIRLGRLADPVFAAFADGRINLDVASAYAATEDQALQTQVFERLIKGQAYNHVARTVRQALGVGDLEQARRLAFVGDDAYRAAGGRFESDLFAEDGDARGRVVDPPVLDRLVDAKLGAEREKLRKRFGKADLRFQPKPPQTEYGSDDYSLHIAGRHSPLPKDLPDGEIVAHLAIDARGKIEPTLWWASRKAKFGSQRNAASKAPPPKLAASQSAIADAYTARPAANALLKADEGINSDSIEMLRTQRRAILRMLLVANAERGGRVGQDYLTWAQLRAAFAAEPPHLTGMKPLGHEQIGTVDLMQRAAALVDGSGVKARVDFAVGMLGPILAEQDRVKSFRAFRALPELARLRAAALVAGHALERSLAAPGYAIDLHDAVAAETGLADGASIRELGWEPSEALIALSPRAQRLELVDADDKTRARWNKGKSDDVTAQVLEAALDDESWVHPLLKFFPASGGDDSPRSSRACRGTSERGRSPEQTTRRTRTPTAELEAAE